MNKGKDILFRAGQIGGLKIENRVVVSPMTRISATEAGLATERMADYYARFARHGFGLVMTEGTYTDEAFSQGYRRQPGIANKAQENAWRRVVDAVHEHQTPIVIQLMHAGALVSFNRFRSTSKAPSAIRPGGERMAHFGGRGPYAAAEELTGEEIDAIVASFADAAERAVACGFDGIELHGAYGYLIDEFITDYTNRRDDHLGGSLENRLRFPCMLIENVKRRVGDEIPVGIRLSQAKVNDFDHRWDMDSARTIFKAVVSAGADFIDAASFDAAMPIRGQTTSFASAAKRSVDVPVIANGKLEDPQRAISCLAEGHADFVSLANGALANPDWIDRLRSDRPLAAFDQAVVRPLATLDNEERWRAAQELDLIT